MTRQARSVAIVLGSLACAQPPAPAPTALVGAWSLVSLERTAPGQAPIHPMGTQVVGRLTYDTAGRMSVILGRRDRPRFDVAPGAAGGTPDEIRAAFQGFVAYYGTYSVHEPQKQVIHHIEFASLPNWVGTSQTRTYTLKGDRLILQATQLADGRQVTDRLVWKQLR